MMGIGLGPLAMTMRARVILVALVVPAFVALAGEGALAQSRPTPRVRAAGRPAAPKKAPADAGAAPVAAPVPLPTGPVAAPAATSPADAGLGVVEARTLDGGTRVFKFSELDIEGRLKSPQLVYFLRRVRAEFAAGELGHRSFMREMSETQKESTF